ncbi:MAG: DUF2141 domain-containing protein [Pseudomonadales bacterium]
MSCFNQSLLTSHRLPRVPHVVSDWLLFGLLALMGFSASSAHAETGAAASNPELHLSIDNIRTDQGPIMIQVMNSEAAFNGKAAAIASLILPAREGSVSAVLNALPAGEYAIRVMHDVDGDGELKTNMVGMPKEPWGISNNAAGRFGPPQWEDARFTLPATSPQAIELR